METLPPGWTVSPPDHELTDRYLHRELSGHPVPGTLDFVHHVDVYSADPEHLVEKLAPAPGTGKGDKPPVWYFVSVVRSAGGRKTAGGRKARAVVGGTWHGENTKAVKGSKLGGYVKTFTYARKSASEEGLERLGWIMKEFNISAQNGGGDRVLCKIYRTPRKNSMASSSTTTSSSVSNSGESKKRKAAGDHPHAPTPSARRTEDEDKFTENVRNVFMEGSGESEHYGVEGHYYGTAPGGETMELSPCVQERFLPSSEFYGTTDVQGGDLEVPPSIEDLLNQPSDYQPSEEEIQAMMRELSSWGTMASSSTTSLSSVSDSSKKRKADGDHPHAPTPSARRTEDEDKFTENARHVFMEGSGETEHYGAAAYFYVPGGGTMELPPCVQESFLPSSDFYGTADLQERDIDPFRLFKLAAASDYRRPSEEETQAKMREVTSWFTKTSVPS